MRWVLWVRYISSPNYFLSLKWSTPLFFSFVVERKREKKQSLKLIKSHRCLKTWKLKNISLLAIVSRLQINTYILIDVYKIHTHFIHDLQSVFYFLTSEMFHIEMSIPQKKKRNEHIPQTPQNLKHKQNFGTLGKVKLTMGQVTELLRLIWKQCLKFKITDKNSPSLSSIAINKR